MRTIAPVSPGEMLEEEFLKPLGLTKYRLAKDIGVPPQRIGDIVAQIATDALQMRQVGGRRVVGLRPVRRQDVGDGAQHDIDPDRL